MKARFKPDGVLEKYEGGTWYPQFCHKSKESGLLMCSLSCTCCNRGELTLQNKQTGQVVVNEVIAIQCVTPNIILEYDNGGIVKPPKPGAN